MLSIPVIVMFTLKTLIVLMFLILFLLTCIGVQEKYFKDKE